MAVDEPGSALGGGPDMIEILTDVPPGVVGVRAGGILTRDEYDSVVVPMLDEAESSGRRLRILCEVGADYRGLTPGALWEDLRLGTRAMHLFDACAVVSDVTWIREATRLARFFMPCPVRVFAERDRAEAAAWLAALPETPSISVRLDEQTGTVVVEAAAPLRGVDFDALAATVDPWLSTHETVAGVVFHAHTVPGWENVTGLRRHLQFVREHHRRVRRVALAVDGVLPSLAPAVAGHLVAPEVRHFAYDALDDAVAWAGAGEDNRG
jgi:hypothetical protein